jgi:hypothetical protein
MIYYESEADDVSICGQLKLKHSLLFYKIKGELHELKQNCGNVFILDTENIYGSNPFNYRDTYEWSVVHWKSMERHTIKKSKHLFPLSSTAWALEVIRSIHKFIIRNRENRGQSIFIYFYGSSNVDKLRLESAFVECKLVCSYIFIDVQRSIIKKIMKASLNEKEKTNRLKLVCVKNLKLETIYQSLFGLTLCTFHQQLFPRRHCLKSMTDVFHLSDALTVIFEEFKQDILDAEEEEEESDF